MRKWWYRRILIILTVLTSVMGTGFGMEQIQAKEENSEVSSHSLDSQKVCWF